MVCDAVSGPLWGPCRGVVYPQATRTYGPRALGFAQVKAYWPCVGLRPAGLHEHPS